MGESAIEDILGFQPIEKVTEQTFPGSGDFIFFILMALFAKYIGKVPKEPVMEA